MNLKHKDNSKYNLKTGYEIWRTLIPKNIDFKSTNRLNYENNYNVHYINQYIYRDEDFLGKGFFAKVYKFFNTQENKYYACKIFERDFLLKMINLNGELVKIEDFVTKEILASYYLRHESLLQAFELLDDPSYSRIYLILDLCDSELCRFNSQYKLYDNSQWLKNSSCDSSFLAPDETRLKRIFREITSAVAYLHRLNLTHCDIKPQNIMVKNGHAKLADLGSLAWFDQKNPYTSSKDNGFGTPYYLAPEAISKKDFSKVDKSKLDVWALGMTFFSTAFGYLPFELNRTKVIPNNFYIQWNLVDEIYSYSSDLRDFLNFILKIEEYNRPSVFDIFNHEYLKQEEKVNYYSVLCDSSQNVKIFEDLPLYFFKMYGLNKDYMESFDDVFDENDKISRTISKPLETINAVPNSSSLAFNHLNTSNDISDYSHESGYYVKFIDKTIDVSQDDEKNIEDINNSISKNKLCSLHKISSKKGKKNDTKNKTNDTNNSRFIENKHDDDATQVGSYKEIKKIKRRNSNTFSENYKDTPEIETDDIMRTIYDSISHKHRSMKKDDKFFKMLRRRSDSNYFSMVEVKNILNSKDHIIYECIDKCKNLEL